MLPVLAKCYFLNAAREFYSKVHETSVLWETVLYKIVEMFD